MALASPQLTPAQLIESGRRAEADGRLDLAVQFYRHLTEHFAEAVEAAEAHGALGRIGVWQSEDAGAQTAARRTLRKRPPAGHDRYATGRVLTRLFGLLGWLVALAGLAAVPACLVLPVVSGACPARPEVLPLAGGAAGSLILGFGVVLAAHVARARFDQANAMRELVALERAKLGLD